LDAIVCEFALAWETTIAGNVAKDYFWLIIPHCDSNHARMNRIGACIHNNEWIIEPQLLRDMAEFRLRKERMDGCNNRENVEFTKVSDDRVVEFGHEGEDRATERGHEIPFYPITCERYGEGVI
jgi:hypothetical protein